MLLVPCTACQRHVVETAGVCPFCAASLIPQSRALVVRPGRFSRAAIFAGLAACYTSGPPPATPTTPPPPPPSPHDDSFAQPPNDTKATPDPVGGAVLYGRLRHARTGAPLAGVTVEVWTSAGVPTTATTNAKGEYAVRGLEVREYQVSFVGPDGIRYSAGPIVELHSESERYDYALDPVPMPIPKPYGAPLARRRIV